MLHRRVRDAQISQAIRHLLVCLPRVIKGLVSHYRRLGNCAYDTSSVGERSRIVSEQIRRKNIYRRSESVRDARAAKEVQLVARLARWREITVGDEFQRWWAGMEHSTPQELALGHHGLALPPEVGLDSRLKWDPQPPPQTCGGELDFGSQHQAEEESHDKSPREDGS